MWFFLLQSQFSFFIFLSLFSVLSFLVSFLGSFSVSQRDCWASHHQEWSVSYYYIVVCTGMQVVCLECDIDLHLLQGSDEVIGDDDMKLCSNQFSVNFPSLFDSSPQKVRKFLLSLVRRCVARCLKSLWHYWIRFSQVLWCWLSIGSFSMEKVNSTTWSFKELFHWLRYLPQQNFQTGEKLQHD